MSSINKPKPPADYTQFFDEKEALSKILAEDREKFLQGGGKVTEVKAQNSGRRLSEARAAVGSGLSVLDAYINASE